MSAAALPGDLRHLGPYELVRELKSGGMARLYLGRRSGPGGFARHVAIKTVHAHLAGDETFIQMFLSEARLAAQLSHPNIVQVEDLGEVDGVYFMAMELIRGVSLHQVFRVARKAGVPIAPELAVRIASEVAGGLHAAHIAIGNDGEPLKIVHRDVSPQNVMVTWSGQVKLLDFGIAKASHDQTTGDTLKGKLRYMPPEQAWGRGVDARTDVYALGLVLWEALTGRRRFQGRSDFELLEAVRTPSPLSTRSAGAEVSDELESVLAKALEANPDDRYPTAKAFREALQQTPEAGISRDALAEHVTSQLQDVRDEQNQMLPSSAPSVTGARRPVTAPSHVRELPESGPTVTRGRVAAVLLAATLLGGGFGLYQATRPSDVRVTALGQQAGAARGALTPAPTLPAPVAIQPSDVAPVSIALGDASTLTAGSRASLDGKELLLETINDGSVQVRVDGQSHELSGDEGLDLVGSRLSLVWADNTVGAARIRWEEVRARTARSGSMRASSMRTSTSRTATASAMDATMQVSEMAAPVVTPMDPAPMATMDSDFSAGVFESRMRSIPVREL